MCDDEKDLSLEELLDKHIDELKAEHEKALAHQQKMLDNARKFDSETKALEEAKRLAALKAGDTIFVQHPIHLEDYVPAIFLKWDDAGNAISFICDYTQRMLRNVKTSPAFIALGGPNANYN